MSGRGVFFAVDDAQLERLLVAEDDAQVDLAVDALAAAGREPYLARCDRAWDALHRCLTDGTLDPDAGQYPLNHCVLGGRALHDSEERVVVLVMPTQVRDVSRALHPITPEWLRERFFTIAPQGYAPRLPGPDAFASTWSRFEDVRQLYTRAAEEGRAVLFCATYD